MSAQERPTPDAHPCLITETHGRHIWSPMVIDPDHDHVFHIGMAELVCPGVTKEQRA